jgi:hypothetical protein
VFATLIEDSQANLARTSWLFRENQYACLLHPVAQG